MSEKVLFISSRCQFSKKILIGLKQYDFMRNLFTIVNIDKQPYPNYIQSVPSLLINGQVISGETLFEYLGKIVEEKKQHDLRIQNNKPQEKDQGQCKINEDGELEGWCSSGSAIEFSTITEDNDDYTKKIYKIDTNYESLDGSDMPIQNQIKQMEKTDESLTQKRKQFDSDFERIQRERGEIGSGGGQQSRMDNSMFNR
jgi:predicted RNase H-like nuclease (RuvC/YqgF family)